MKGDISRSTYRAANHYSGVRLQQGRVLLDAEWNEHADIGHHVDRTTTVDVVGPTGAPKHPPTDFKHFKVAVTQNGADLLVAPGRIYVDGILCENDVAGGVAFTHQADLPGASLPPASGSYAVYLDVWERHLTPVDQHGPDFPPLLESALNGPDTATRTRVVWQVKLVQVQSKSCTAFTKPPDPTGQLRAQEIKSATPGNDCLVPVGGGYRRLENQLYRVEIHEVTAGGTTFKWSRDNGCAVSRVKAIDVNALTIVVEDPGHDPTLGFAAAKFVELIDEERLLRGQPGVLLQVKTVTGASVLVLNPGNLSLAVGTNPTLRRWDGTAAVAANHPMELEDGVQIEFDGGTFTSGDYWLIPARTLAGRVEWPRDGTNPPAPIFETRRGTAHHYGLLAVVDFAGGVFSPPLDCRDLFPPLTAIVASDVSYDPAKCANLTGATTVQAAIDILCRAAAPEPAVHVQAVAFASGRPVQNDGLVEPRELARGLRITCDTPVFPDTARNAPGQANPVCFVTLDIPWPLNPSDRTLWGVGAPAIVGFQPLTLAATVASQGNDIIWTPLAQAPNNVSQWLAESLLSTISAQTRGQIQRVLAHLTLKGNFIWSQADPKQYLDGETFGVSGPQGTRVALPSGDGRRGGTLEMWFWLVLAPPPTPTVTVPTLTVTLPTVTTVPTITVTGPTIVTVPTIVGPPVARPRSPSVIVPPREGRGAVARSQPLKAVKGLTRAQATKLEASGIRDAAALAGADPGEVAAALGIGNRTRAEALVEAAKRLQPSP